MNEHTNVIPDTPSAKEYQEAERKNTDWVNTQNPIALFSDWLAAARKTELNDSNAMSLATVDENGLPDVRIVLLKGLDKEGFVFYSNAQSAKGEQLKHPKAALCFHWKTQKRQVRVRGAISEVSEAEADAYFAKRARGSRVGAWASDQSRPVSDRQTMVNRVAEMDAKYKGKDVPRPPHWKGWRVAPEHIEFWQDGAFRLHDRIVFRFVNSGWEKTRLYP
jgi:pyridoxamine 5'-phosphate oxidase